MNHIYCLVQLKNGNVLTGGSQGVLTLWDIKADKKIETIRAHKGNIYSVIELQDGRFASSGSDSFINIWDIKNESDNNIEPKCIDIMPNIPLKKEIKIVPIKEPEQNNIKINNDNINEINTSSFAPIKSINEVVNLNANPYNPFKLNEPQNTTNIPKNENSAFNPNPTINNINLGTTNQQIIKMDSNAADTEYGGNGVHNDLPKNVGYGSSGISQNNNLNNLNNQNNININSTMFPQNQGINTNQISPVINKDININEPNKENTNIGLINETNKIENNINKNDNKTIMLVIINSQIQFKMR